MSIEIEIKPIEVDSDSLYRTQKVRFNSEKKIITPAKSIPLDRLKLANHLNPNSRQLNEIFKRFDAKQIKLANEDNSKSHDLEVWFNSQKSKVEEETVTFCFIDFNEKRIPTDEEIEFMTDIEYCNSDITTIPFINHINKPKQSEISYEAYKTYVGSAIEIIEQLNKKAIMGVIPKLAPKNVADLLDFYRNKGINSFAIDLDGSNPISANLRIFKVLKVLKKMNLLDNSYLHGHNVGMRVNKMADVIPAKDILCFGLGLNSLGEKRKIFIPNRVFMEYIKLNPLNKYRLFDKKNYGYWKEVSHENIKEMLPEDCSLDRSLFNNLSQRDYLQRIFNAEQLALEAHQLRNIINEDPHSSLEYIKNKKYVLQDDIKVIEKGKSKIK